MIATPAQLVNTVLLRSWLENVQPVTFATVEQHPRLLMVFPMLMSAQLVTIVLRELPTSKSALMDCIRNSQEQGRLTSACHVRKVTIV